MFVCEDPAVDELLEFLHVGSDPDEGVGGGVFPMAQYAQKQVVRGDPVAACPHRFFAGVVYD